MSQNEVYQEGSESEERPSIDYAELKSTIVSAILQAVLIVFLASLALGGLIFLISKLLGF